MSGASLILIQEVDVLHGQLLKQNNAALHMMQLVFKTIHYTQASVQVAHYI